MIANMRYLFSLSQITDKNSNCPNPGLCQPFLDRIKKRSLCALTDSEGNKNNTMKWGYTRLSNLMGEFDRTTVPYGGVAEEKQHKNKKKNSKKRDPYHTLLEANKDWELFRCGTCGWITHAVATTNEEDMGGDSASVGGDNNNNNSSGGSARVSGGSGSGAPFSALNRTLSSQMQNQTRVAVVTNYYVKDNNAKNYFL